MRKAYRRKRDEIARREWLERAAQWDGRMRAVDAPRNSRTAHHAEKLPGDHPAYRERVAIPVMDAVDSMPGEFRALVHRFGYVDVYRAWRKSWTPQQVVAKAEQAGGFFVL